MASASARSRTVAPDSSDENVHTTLTSESRSSAASARWYVGWRSKVSYTLVRDAPSAMASACAARTCALSFRADVASSVSPSTKTTTLGKICPSRCRTGFTGAPVRGVPDVLPNSDILSCFCERR
ncbi:uncharacterized protein AMSG_11659 [Thecamonas trahens ATCC 50062]|uniref:Uncharacterized protein n=1 Tax=Thecamonas trahens ATCC 50062 TaxID=461836 RepID=A0A0L0DRC7_THETB|nr:hypothetical protein AMSG_11659 [Thecamonas trahens ATCC 50062]KNC54807.1 hypothetical protein AMSG_11659 [Thecamonas trahens ATCC 50062]|eukprot:XP_013761769.1 hypothetical protein AMSG_11659 [Thecamonas trahens ATCC 50062]